MAVRVALGETELVQEIRRFLIENGVSLDSFSQVRCPAEGSNVDLPLLYDSLVLASSTLFENSN